MAATAITARPGQAASRQDRRGHDGVQGGPQRSHRQHGEAITILRKRGLAQAAKRAGRATAQGLFPNSGRPQLIHMAARSASLWR